MGFKIRGGNLYFKTKGRNVDNPHLPAKQASLSIRPKAQVKLPSITKGHSNPIIGHHKGYGY